MLDVLKGFTAEVRCSFCFSVQVCWLFAERGGVVWLPSQPWMHRATEDVNECVCLALGKVLLLNSCSPARSPSARKPLLSHIFIGSLSALDYRVQKEVPATCISSRGWCTHRVTKVGSEIPGAKPAPGCLCQRVGKQTRNTPKIRFKKLLQNDNGATSSYEPQAKQNKRFWHDFDFQISAFWISDFYFLLSTAASIWRQSLISRKPVGFCSHFCGIMMFQAFFKHCNCFSPEIWLKILIAILIGIKIFSHFPSMLEFDPIFLESLVLGIFLYSILFHIHCLWGINFYKLLFLREWQAFCKYSFWAKK